MELRLQLGVQKGMISCPGKWGSRDSWAMGYRTGQDSMIGKQDQLVSHCELEHGLSLGGQWASQARKVAMA